MRIRKLELQGFKSFADRASFHFGAGISGVVGPNGCGKSNVIDAVKWCIGEQSAKSLRGDSMSDVIFNGSAGRKPVNFAEVSLTFAADGEPFPGIWQRFEELEVTRRLFRDGHSEYLINQERVRLRDITELFMDSGVGNQLYSVIEQGRIGLIVHAKPEQRRSLIEEAAGISRYKARREETMARLADTRASLERVADVAEEMSRQLRAAERQVQKVVRWRTLNARVRQEEIAVGLIRCAGLLADRRALGEQQRSATSELEQAARSVDRLEEELVTRRTALEALEEEANGARDRLAEVEAQRRVEESAAQYQAREAEQARDRLQRLEADQAEARSERDRATAEAADAASRRTAADATLARARTEADAQGVRARTAEEGVRAAREGLGRARTASMAAYELMVRARTAREAAVARQQELTQRVGKALTSAQEARASVATAAEEVARVAEQVAAAEASTAAASRDVEQATRAGREAVERAQADARAAVDARQQTGRADLERRRSEARARVDAAQAEGRRGVEAAQVEGRRAVEVAQAEVRAGVEAARARQARADAARESAATALRTADSALTEATRRRERIATRLGALEDLQRGSADLPDGMRAALGVPGVLGLLGAQLDVPAEREAVLLRALDGALDTVLVPDWETAARVAAVAGGARLRMLVVPSGAEPRGLAADIPGTEGARAALTVLLGDLDVVDDVAAAAIAWRPGRRVVTRDGALVREDGVLVLGGEPEGAGAAALRRRREIAALGIELAAADEELARCRGTVDDARQSLEACIVEARTSAQAVNEAQAVGNAAVQAAQQRANAAVQAAQAAAATAVQAAQSAGAQDVEAAQGALAADLQAAQSSTAQAVEEARRTADARTEATRAELRQRETVLGEVRHRLRDAEAERARAQRTVDAAQADHASLVAQIAACESDATRAGADASTAAERHEGAEDEVRRGLGALERLEPELAEATEALQRARLEAATSQKDLTGATNEERLATERAERAAERSRLIAQERNDLETRLSGLAVAAEATARRLQELGEAQGQVREELQGLRERLAEDRDRVKGVDAQARTARDLRDGARDRLASIETRLAEVRGTLERVRGDVEEKHGISLPGLLDRMDRDGQILLEGHTAPPDAIGGEDVPTLRMTRTDLDTDVTSRAEALTQARDALSRIGEVNFAAEEEYREVSERHADIERQRVDLVEAMDVIEKSIAKLNRTCRERFRETFDLVAGHFEQIYPRLVGGGSGRLQLTDEEDLLTCGVDLMVQPPGKRVQNLSLLSGGEKAMAAIGLIFSLFRVKPSPFCLLDEVDAPLDEGNGGRFNEMLREMSAVSQFIVITHNKKTMECADVLYGVTMPEPGTSRLVTVRIDG